MNRGSGSIARDTSSSASASEHDSSEEKKECTSASQQNAGSCKDNGGNGDDEEEYESEMRGVHAKTNIPADTICVAIPRKCLITVEMGQATEIGQIILRSDLDLDAPKHIFLMVFLLWDRKINGDQSFFKPYYDILPKTLRNIPIFWNDEELEYLHGSYLLTQIADRIDAITEDYYAICQVAPQLANIATLEEFKWARMCVCSRNFGLQIDGHRTSALVPHADMLNHHRPRETKWSFDDDLQAFTITTLQSITKGSQVYDSYGQKCNHRFLLNYGFAVEDNSELDGFCPNEVPIELSIPANDPLYEARYEFWMRGECDGSSTSSSLGHSSHHALSVVMAAAANAGANANVNANANVPLSANSSVSASAGASNVTSSSHSSVTASRSQSTNSAIAASSTLEAVAGAIGSTNHNVNTLSTVLHRPTRSQSEESESSAALSVKRVRVCVSSNENTRILFSMLRVLAANEGELRAMSTAPTLPFGDSGCSVYLSRALRGYTAANPDSAAFVTMQHAAFFRTCRDIRNPINLRNEKGAMQCLLNVVASALEAYPCSLAQDVADLMDEEAYPMFSNRRHAKIQVRGEKEVLHHFALWAQTGLDVIEVIERELSAERGQGSQLGLQLQVGQESSSVNSNLQYDKVIQAIEENDNVHFTILRYCSDVLGALRKDAFQTIRRERDSSRNCH